MSLDEGEWLASRAGRFTLGTPALMNRRLNETKSRSEMFGEKRDSNHGPLQFLVPTRIRNLDYTDYANDYDKIKYKN